MLSSLLRVSRTVSSHLVFSTLYKPTTKAFFQLTPVSLYHASIPVEKRKSGSQLLERPVRPLSKKQKKRRAQRLKDARTRKTSEQLRKEHIEKKLLGDTRQLSNISEE
jgi:hypothetical protein